MGFRYKKRDPDALKHLCAEYFDIYESSKFIQFLFFKQWKALKQYANNNGIKIIGDIPIYVDYESADVWSSPELFDLDEDLRCKNVAGVPPDYFAKTDKFGVILCITGKRIKTQALIGGIKEYSLH